MCPMLHFAARIDEGLQAKLFEIKLNKSLTSTEKFQERKKVIEETI